VHPIAYVRRKREIISIAGATASVSRANDKRGIRGPTTVQFVVIGTFRFAGLAGNAGAFDVIVLDTRVRYYVDGFILGLGGRVNGSDFGMVTTFLDEIITLLGGG